MADHPATLRRGLGLFDATTIVVGSMIGSGIFIVSAESSRLLGSPGWLLAAMYIRETIAVLDRLPMTSSEREQIYNGNAIRLLKLT